MRTQRARRRRITLTAMCAALALLAGCVGGGTDDAPDDSEDGSAADDGAAEDDGSAAEDDDADAGDTGTEETVHLTWWDYHAEGAIPDEIEAQLAQYNEENPGVTVERQFVAYGDIQQRLLQSAGADALPDVVLLNNPDHHQFVELGIAADLTDRLEEWGELDRYVEGGVASASLDGRVYGLPITVNCLALFYNVEAFDEAGLEPPTTWDELETAAAELTEGDRYGLAYSAINNQQAVFQWLPTLWQSGGDLTALDSPESVEALEFWAGMVDDGSVSREALSWDQGQVKDEFAQGRAAMMINGPWQIPALAGDAPDLEYGVALLPENREAASALGGENFMIIDGPNNDAAWDLVRWMQDPERLEALAQATGSLPVRDDVAPTSDEANYGVFVEQVQVARPRAYGPNYAEIADHVVNALQSRLSGGVSSEDALNTAAQAVEPLLP